jgi:hypothetical protein
MKRIGIIGFALFFVVAAAADLFAQQTSTAGQVFDNSRPATGQGNPISTSNIPISLPPAPATVQGAPVQSSAKPATAAPTGKKSK